jgi:hypothetical protein
MQRAYCARHPAQFQTQTGPSAKPAARKQCNSPQALSYEDFAAKMKNEANRINTLRKADPGGPDLNIIE